MKQLKLVAISICSVLLLLAFSTGPAYAQFEFKLTASDKEAGDRFGFSVSISGDRAIVGALFEDTGGINAGAAYIFERDGSGNWNEVAKVQASDKEAGDFFGISVSISGDRAIVGADREDTGGFFAGAAYVVDLRFALIAGKIKNFVASGTLNQGQGNSLIAILEAASQQLSLGHTTQSIRQLGAFINLVNQYINAGILSLAEGQPLIDLAQAIIDDIQSGLGKQAGETVSLEQVPYEYKVFQNYPNPFNPTTTIHYELPLESFVTLKVFDVLGKEVKTLIEGYRTEGRYEVEFDATNLPSGIYFYRLRAGEYINTKKMILMK